MKGLITEDRERLRFHLLDVNRCLIDLNSVYRPNLSIVDGIIALESICPLPTRWESGRWIVPPYG